jgi:hypothetical protein
MLVSGHSLFGAARIVFAIAIGRYIEKMEYSCRMPRLSLAFVPFWLRLLLRVSKRFCIA